MFISAVTVLFIKERKTCPNLEARKDAVQKRGSLRRLEGRPEPALPMIIIITETKIKGLCGQNISTTLYQAVNMFIYATYCLYCALHQTGCLFFQIASRYFLLYRYSSICNDTPIRRSVSRCIYMFF